MTKEQEELLLKQGKMLPVMEHFYTIQGEGFHAGKAAYFIRLGGCDVGCHWCDVKDVLYSSYNVTKQSKLSSTVLICGGSHWPRCEKWDVPAYTNC